MKDVLASLTLCVLKSCAILLMVSANLTKVTDLFILRLIRKISGNIKINITT